MNIRHLTVADYVAQPWKNGGGTTTQIALDARGDRWCWRVSVADVRQSGPFSDFDGFDRIIMLIEGDGMLLSFEGAPARIDALFRPFTFDGGWKANCQLIDGPVRNLNLIVDRRYGRGAMEAISVESSTASTSLRGKCDLLYCVAGSAEAIVAGERTIVGTGDTLRIDDCGGLALALRALAKGTIIVHMSVQPQ